MRVPACQCPLCSELLNAVSDPFGNTPDKGDLAVCFYCDAFLTFDDHLRLRLLTPPEIAQLSPEQLAAMTTLRINSQRKS